MQRDIKGGYDVNIIVFRLMVKGYDGDPKSKFCPYLNEKEKKAIQAVWDYVDKSGIEVPYKPVEKREDLIHEFLVNNKLRQGWGTEYGGMSLDLRQVKNNDYGESLKVWNIKYILLNRILWDKKVTCKQACGRYEILSLMKKAEVGDIVIVPRVPHDNYFAVARVDKKGYSFERFNDFSGHMHVLNVDNYKIFKYSENGIERVTFRHCRNAINEIKRHHIIYPLIEPLIENLTLSQILHNRERITIKIGRIC